MQSCWILYTTFRWNLVEDTLCPVQLDPLVSKSRYPPNCDTNRSGKPIRGTRQSLTRKVDNWFGDNSRFGKHSFLQIIEVYHNTLTFRRTGSHPLVSKHVTGSENTPPRRDRTATGLRTRRAAPYGWHSVDKPKLDFSFGSVGIIVLSQSLGHRTVFFFWHAKHVLNTYNVMCTYGVVVIITTGLYFDTCLHGSPGVVNETESEE